MTTDPFIVTVYRERNYNRYQYIDPKGWECSSSAKQAVLDRLRRDFGIRNVRFVPVNGFVAARSFLYAVLEACEIEKSLKAS